MITLSRFINSKRMGERSKKKSSISGEWFVMGVALGVMFGIIFDNIALWLPLGVCFGLVEPGLKKIKKDKSN